MLGQYETVFFEKKYQTDLMTGGVIQNVDFVASAIKEAFAASGVSDRDIYLILPQECFSFFRIEVPIDIASSAIASFVQDKARSLIPANQEETLSDYVITDNENKKLISYFAIDMAIVSKLKEALQLIDLKLTFILPETLSYFKLFEKTLRKDKKENIWYVSYNDPNLVGYLYDSYGLLSSEKWTSTVNSEHTIETALKEKAELYETDGKKLNRLILSGEGSDAIRQDTFTKSIGVWTNPLKRIISNFYQDYIKLLLTGANNKPFPILTYDTCFGAFIFSQENKQFSFFKSGTKIPTTMGTGGKSVSLSKPKIGKEILIFIASFVLSFGLFILISRANINVSLPFIKAKPTVAPLPTEVPPTPTPTISPNIKRDEIKVKILNGSGTVGKAGDVKSVLKDLGYSDIVTDNADNFDYTQSVLQIKKSKAELSGLMKKDLQKYVASFKEQTLDEKDPADIVIIVGTDFK